LYGVQTIIMKKEISGQPYLLVRQKNDSFRLTCSIAHSVDVGVAAIAIDERTRVGVDAERVRVFTDELLNQFMTDEELKYLATVPKEVKMITATRIWTLKEAYLKLHGVGLKQHPSTVNTLFLLSNTFKKYHSLSWSTKNQKIVTVIVR
jgi:4'-phosphopantetheinyl transferase